MTTHLEYLRTQLALLEESPTNAGAADLIREEIKAEEAAQKPKTVKPKEPTEGAK